MACTCVCSASDGASLEPCGKSIAEMRITRSFGSGVRLARGYLSSRCQPSGGWDGAKARLLSGVVRGVSLDCFDTLLARHEADWEQYAVADHVAKAKGMTERDARDVLDAAIRKAKKDGGGPDNEPDTVAIWAAFCDAMALPSRFTNSLTDIEYSLLEMSVSANPCALDFVALLEQRGIPWLVCSDSRWHGGHLARLLTARGFPVQDRKIFTSCEHGLSKFRGNLYGLAQDYWQVTLGPAGTPENILHVGDNLFADCCSAACFGWQAIGVPPAHPTADMPIMEFANAPLNRLHQEISGSPT